MAARHTYPIDSTRSNAELASFPCSCSTAENMLTRAQVDENDTVLITGASGAIAGPIVDLGLRTLYLKDQRFLGCTVLDKGVFSRLVNLIELDAIQPLLARSFPLEALLEAQKCFLRKKFTRKLVIDMSL